MNKWMKKLSDDILISEINLPGTHDTCARFVDLPHVTKCQELSVFEQLCIGVRCLDMRGALGADGIKCVHSIIRCRTSRFGRKCIMLKDAVADIKRFLIQNPSETVIFMLKCESGAEQKLMLEELYGNIINNDKKFWFTENRIPALGEVRGKIVLVNRCEADVYGEKKSGIRIGAWRCSDVKKGDFSFFDFPGNNGGKYFIQDDYQLSPAVKWFGAVLPVLEHNLQEGVVLNYFSANDAVHSPKQCCEYIYPKLSEYELINGKKYGWLIFDYPQKKIHEKLINTNF